MSNYAKSVCGGLLFAAAITLTVTYVSGDGFNSRSRRDIQGTKIDDIRTILKPYSEIDLVLMIDSSQGMGKNEFYLREREIMESILKQYAMIHPSYVRLAVVVFALTPVAVINTISTADTLNKCQLFGGASPSWNSVTYLQTDLRGTDVLEALRMGETILESGRQRRQNVTQLIVLATDADYNVNDHEATKLKSQEIRNQNISIFTIGAGNWLEPASAEAIASPNYYAKLIDVWKPLLLETAPYTSYTPGDMNAWQYDNGAKLDSAFCGGSCPANAQCYCDPLTGVQSCQCDAGFYSAIILNTNESICTPCPSHNYKDVVGNQACTVCPPPTYTNSTGSTSKSSCVCPSDVQSCVDECDPNPCGPNSICTNDNTEKFTCQCDVGWEDIDPAANVWDCSQHVLGLCAGGNDCQHGSTCIDMDEGYVCVCPWGYSGERCEVVKDMCQFSFCDNGGTCTSLINGYRCACTPQFQGSVCKDPVTTTTSTTTSNVTTTTTTTTTTTPTPTTTTVSITPAPVTDDNTMLIIIGAAAGGGGFLLLLIIIIVIACCCCRRKKEPPVVDEEANEKADGARLYRKNRSAKQTISNRFSDFWKKKTMRPGSFFFNDSNKGLPSVPPRRRPDLLGHMNDGMSTIESESEVEYAVMDNQQIQDTGGMDGWMKYINDIQQGGLVQKACILKLTGKKRACSDNWDYENSETDKLLTIMENEDSNVPALVQRGEYHIYQNNGSIAVGKTIGEEQERKLMVIGKTKTFLVVGIVDANEDSGQCLKEIEWITDHIKTEGY